MLKDGAQGEAGKDVPALAQSPLLLGPSSAFLIQTRWYSHTQARGFARRTRRSLVGGSATPSREGPGMAGRLACSQCSLSYLAKQVARWWPAA